MPGCSVCVRARRAVCRLQGRTIKKSIGEATMQDEKRKHPRFNARDNAFVAFKANVGKIKDISMGGASFDIITTEEADVPDAHQMNTLDIFLFGNCFQLSNVQYRPVYHLAAAVRNTPKQIFSSVFQNIVCAVEFLNLDAFQADSLNHFLQQHTVGMSA
jgi:hypothetical protein